MSQHEQRSRYSFPYSQFIENTFFKNSPRYRMLWSSLSLHIHLHSVFQTVSRICPSVPLPLSWEVRQRQAGLWVQSQPGLRSEFQDSQGYIEKPCLGGGGGEIAPHPNLRLGSHWRMSLFNCSLLLRLFLVMWNTRNMKFSSTKSTRIAVWPSPPLTSRTLLKDTVPCRIFFFLFFVAGLIVSLSILKFIKVGACVRISLILKTG